MGNAFALRKRGENAYSVTIPRWLGETLYDLGYLYVAQLTDEGILLKPLEKLTPDGPLPSWARKEG